MARNKSGEPFFATALAKEEIVATTGEDFNSLRGLLDKIQNELGPDIDRVVELRVIDSEGHYREIEDIRVRHVTGIGWVAQLDIADPEEGWL